MIKRKKENEVKGEMGLIAFSIIYLFIYLFYLGKRFTLKTHSDYFILILYFPPRQTF